MHIIRIIPHPIPQHVIKLMPYRAPVIEPPTYPGCCPTCKRKMPKPRRVIDPYEKRIAKAKAAINAGLRKPMPTATQYKA